MRPGELAGLRLEDINLEGLSVQVVQSVWAGKVQAPRNANAVRQLAISPLLDGLGIKRRGLNAFRHTSASFMDRLNTPMTVRQERLGHAPGSPVTLAHYTHSVGEDNRKVADQMGAAWGMVN